ncbi:hypothetical protein THERMOT_232 [Bathymodiolus thermophilus thioautotrophic gill symbiont]|uniref:AAA family ATPase n=1 Tax=Bathymodiolus thermophilus thioautotrophic gill symbiont TaxID=2360 RepID=UPI00192B82C3|nr:AAA family ATPase [Bathymodiolus thermophilus thioautotrophic gill symbiont]CAB5495048.1 hypothetical protein THERMOT_232 [Bathymodiolus thermophilus thioautotrophic gill symbiont]
MNEHFIKNIKIEKFKCFENFKAKGFSRVNLITGKNNVGKTAFMEACFLLSNSFNIFKSHGYNSRKGALGIDRDWFHFEIVKLMLEVQQNISGQTSRIIAQYWSHLSTYRDSLSHDSIIGDTFMNQRSKISFTSFFGNIVFPK